VQNLIWMMMNFCAAILSVMLSYVIALLSVTTLSCIFSSCIFSAPTGVDWRAGVGVGDQLGETWQQVNDAESHVAPFPRFATKNFRNCCRYISLIGVFARSDTSELMYGIWSHKIIVSQLPNVKTAWSKVQLSRLDIGGLRQTDRRTDSRTCRP